jgi:uncharacterized protein
MSYSVDANILLYASDTDNPVSARAQEFLAERSEDPDLFCIAWTTVMAYLRIATHPSIFPRPLAPKEAIANVESLLALPRVRVLNEADGFLEAYRAVTQGTVIRGNLVPDAHLATVLRQHGVRRLYTADRGFRRFPFLEVVDPFKG